MKQKNQTSLVFLLILLHVSFNDVLCRLLIAPVEDPQVKAVAGTDVTLGVSFSGAVDPVVTWFKDDLPVLTWTVGSTEPPDVALENQGVLTMEGVGSLKFLNVPLDYGGNYTVELTKSGLDKAVTGFTLTLFELFQQVALQQSPVMVVEGVSESFTLSLTMTSGVVEQSIWFFNGSRVDPPADPPADPHYWVNAERNLVVQDPTRRDTGLYSLLLRNPFNQVLTDINVTVIYGPDRPLLEVSPLQPFLESGDALSLVCQADGFPPPTVTWTFGGQTVSVDGVLNRTDVQTTDGGVYTCTSVNPETGQQRQESLTVNVYEKPWGEASCWVQSTNTNTALQYHCEWAGGAPPAQLWFPELNRTDVGSENLSLTLDASADLDGRTVTCESIHPVQNSSCSATAEAPQKFLPVLTTSVDSQGQIVLTVRCECQATPPPVTSWSAGDQSLSNGTKYQISQDRTLLQIRSFNVSDFLQETYTCTCSNPLGSQQGETRLQGPVISDSSLFPNPEGTVVTLTWEVPPTAVVTGFDVQMKGPNLLSEDGSSESGAPGPADEYRSIQQRPGSTRSTDVFILDPKQTYRFRVVPRARSTEGEPSEEHRIGPGTGLSGSAVAGIAAGIPCSLLLLLLLLGLLLFLWSYCNKNQGGQTRYPVSRGTEKTETSAPPMRPAGLRSPPDYNRLHQTPSERSMTPPSFVPPLPVRTATTV